MAEKRKAQQKLSEINRKTAILNEDIKKKETEKASLAVNISKQKTATGSVSEKNIQEMNLKFNSVSQEVAALKKKPAENESVMVTLNQEIKTIDAELAATSVPTPKISIEVVDTNAASQVGAPEASFSSTESLIAGYESLVAIMETEAQSGVVRKENVAQLEKFSGYLNVPDTSVKEFEEEIGNIIVTANIPTSNSGVVFQSPEEIESKKVTTTEPRTTVSKTAGRRK
jgi:chromosome segregation ATPase